MRQLLLKSRLKMKLIIHPFLFASYANLALMANNITQIKLLAGVRAIIISVGVTLLIVILLRLILKDSTKAGLIASGAIVLTFSYGHIKNITQTRKIATFVIGQDVLLVPLWGFLFGIWAYWVLKKSRNLDQVSSYFNWVSLILNVFPIYTIVTFSGQLYVAEQWVQGYISQVWYRSGVSDVESAIEPLSAKTVPDIYYIVLDAYTRTDVLDELYGYDNSYFIDFLEERGFYVAEGSRANYTDTELSISSSLNMSHINTMPEFFRQNASLDDEGVIRRVVASELIKNNRVKDILQNQGYTVVAFDSGHEISQIKDADVYVSSPNIEEADLWQVGFEVLLLDTSLAQLYLRLKGEDYGPLQKLFTAHRERVLFTLENLSNFAEADGNYFVYAHIVSPHVPYVFGPNGEEIKGVHPYTLLDVHHGQEENIDYYRNQLHYLNTLVMDAIDRIIKKSDTPPIIILQSDHGSKVYREINPPDSVKVKLLLPILNAYHLPNVEYGLLYPTITPVNSFRVVLNHYFRTNLDLLNDTSYILEPINGQQEFVNACEVYEICY